VLLFTVVGDFIEPVADHHHLHAAGEHADAGRRHQRRPYGRGADRHFGVRLDHAALRAGIADGVEIRRRSIAKALRAALPIYVVFLVTITFTIYFPKVVLWLPKQVIPEIGRLLQVAGGDGVYLYEHVTSVVLAFAWPSPGRRHGCSALIFLCW